MSNEVATIDTQSGSDILYQVVQGNLEKLSPADRVRYALQVAQSLGLNPTTAPIQILTLKGKAVLYVRKDGTEQLRKNHKVSLQVVARELLDGEIYAVTARATLPDGRTDESVGAVSLAGLKGEDRANGVMKAETKAKRRVTLSICGLGFLDESEVSDMTHDEPAPVVVEQKPKPRQVEQPRPISDEQRERIDELATTLGITREQIIVGINKKFEAVSAEAAARTANHPPEYQEGIARLHKYIHSNMHLMARTYQQATEHKFPAVAVFFDEELGENNFLPVPEKAFQRLLEEAGLSETWEQFQSQVTSDMVIPAIVELHTKDDHLFYAMTMLTPALLSALALEQQQNTDADGNPKSHYQRAMSWLIERDRFKTESGSTAQLAVKHDHWCASLNLTGLCNCRPEIKAGSRILTYPASILPNNGRRPTSG